MTGGTSLASTVDTIQEKHQTLERLDAGDVEDKYNVIIAIEH